jgi:hypothetical protein
VDEKPVNVLRSLLPERAKEGDWMEAEFDGERLMNMKLDSDETAERMARIAEKLAKLRRKNK